MRHDLGMHFGGFFKFLLLSLGTFLGVVVSLLFEPNVFRGVTLPLVAKSVGWKARAVSARLTPLGKLEIEGLEAVNAAKSRIDLDSAFVVVDLESLLSGKPEIVQADFKFGLIDLEVQESAEGAAIPKVPFSLREAALEITEGRVRQGAGAWILGGVKAQAKGWDGRSPREIQGKVEKLSWNGPGKQEGIGSVGFQAQKSDAGAGLDRWSGTCSADVATVVDMAHLDLVAPCRLALDGQVTVSTGGDWKVEKVHGSWEGVGGAKVAAMAVGGWSSQGNWEMNLNLDPVNLAVVGILFQARGVKSVAGTLGGEIQLEGGTHQPILGRAKLQGQGVQIVSGAGLVWPPRPAELAGVGSGSWLAEKEELRVENFRLELGQKGGTPDLQASLDRPAQFSFQGGVPSSTEAATLQWFFQGVEVATVAPLLVSPDQLKVQGGQLSAQGTGKIQGGTVQLKGRVESRSMRASGPWLQGEARVEMAGIEFRGVLDGTKKVRLEEGTVQAAWAGGAVQDLQAKVTAEWDWGKGSGWVMGDGEVGLAGLGQAWSAAKLWPDSGQAKLHLEFSGNLQDQGKGLASLTLDNMHWAGQGVATWKGRASTELIHQAGQWSMPEIVGQAEQAGQVLLQSQGSVVWTPASGEGKASLDLTRVESSCLVPVLGLITPSWKWQEAAGSGSLQFERKGQQDRVKAKLNGSMRVETGTSSQTRLVDFSSAMASAEATWPTGSTGKLAIQELSVRAQHQDGSDALQVSLDQTLTLEKLGEGNWRPSGQELATGSVVYKAWPIGLFAPLLFPQAKETSMMGTASGFVKVRSDGKKGYLEGEVDLEMRDFTVDLPRVQLRDHQVSLKASVTLGEKGELTIPQVKLNLQKAGRGWLNFTVEREARPALMAKGTADLAVLKEVMVGWSDFISDGDLSLQAEVGDPKDGSRRIGYSAVITGFSGGVADRGGIQGAEVKSQGIVEWKSECQSLQDVVLSAKSAEGNLSVAKLTWKKDGAWAWEGGRFSRGWVAWLVDPWLKPQRWVDGDLVLGAGFWQPTEYGGSGEIDVTLMDGRLVENQKEPDVSVRLDGNFDFDSRVRSLSWKDGSITFAKFPDSPVLIPSLRVGKSSVTAQVRGGTLDLRGLLAQTEAIRNAKPAPAASPTPEDPWKVDLSLELAKIIVEEAEVGPVQVPRFRWGPEGIYLEPSVVQVKGGIIRASVVSAAGFNQPVTANLVMNKFPLGAILGNVITDAKGPIGGWIDLQMAAQAGKPTWEELRKSLTGQGRFRLYQAHLERLPSLQKALAGAGALLGSSFIAGSEINDLGSDFTLQGERIQVPDLQVTGTALSANLEGWLNWWSQNLDFKLKFALTKEAMQSSGQLQGAMTQLIGSSNDYYTKIPGSAMITGSLADPKVQMDVGKMLAEGGINLLLNAPSGILQGAGGAVGGAGGAVTQPAGAILQGVGNLFKW